MLYYNHKARAKELDMRTKFDKEMTKLLKKATDFSEFDTCPVEGITELTCKTERAVMGRYKGFMGEYEYFIAYVHNGKAMKFHTRNEEEADCKMLVVA